MLQLSFIVTCYVLTISLGPDITKQGEESCHIKNET